MDSITVEVEIGHDHRLIEALPPEVPTGCVRLVIEPIEEATRNAQGASVNWRFTTADARIKLARLYPSI